MISSRCRFSLLELNFQTPVCPSVLLKYALPPLTSGWIYQLPHRSFAINGLPYADATLRAKAASSWMEWRRLEMDKVERLSSPKVLEKLWLACSENIKLDSDRSGICIVVQKYLTMQQKARGWRNYRFALRLSNHLVSCTCQIVNITLRSILLIHLTFSH
jgi:hypothetical protein